MDAQMKQEVRDLYNLREAELNTILEYPDKRVTLENGRIFIYLTDSDMIAEIKGFTYMLPDTREKVNSLEEYLQHIKNNNIQTLDEVIEDIGDTPITDDGVVVMDRFKTNEQTIKNIWEKI